VYHARPPAHLPVVPYPDIHYGRNARVALKKLGSLGGQPPTAWRLFGRASPDTEIGDQRQTRLVRESQWDGSCALCGCDGSARLRSVHLPERFRALPSLLWRSPVALESRGNRHRILSAAGRGAARRSSEAHVRTARSSWSHTRKPGPLARKPRGLGTASVRRLCMAEESAAPMANP